MKNLKVFKQPFIMVAPLCFFKFLSKYQIFSLLSCEETSLKENQKRRGETNQTSHLQNDLKSDEERSLINVSSRFWKGFFLNWLQSFGLNPNQLLLVSSTQNYTLFLIFYDRIGYNLKTCLLQYFFHFLSVSKAILQVKLTGIRFQ